MGQTVLASPGCVLPSFTAREQEHGIRLHALTILHLATLLMGGWGQLVGETGPPAEGGLAHMQNAILYLLIITVTNKDQMFACWVMPDSVTYITWS